MKITPLHDRVLVKRVESDTKSKGGIIIPETAKEKPIEGIVVAAGKGRVSDSGETQPLTLKEGDRVLFGKYAGTEIKFDGDDFLIMREEDILCVVDEA